eukprot:15002410-Alexandrium_andersonii.AAC.1
MLDTDRWAAEHDGHEFAPISHGQDDPNGFNSRLQEIDAQLSDIYKRQNELQRGETSEAAS